MNFTDADLRKELLGAIIALAKTSNSNSKTENTDRILIEGLVASKTESFGKEMLQKKLNIARQEKHVLSPNCSTCASPCGNTSEYDLDLWKEEDISCQEAKNHLLSEIQDTAKDVYQAMMLKKDMSEHMEIFYKVLEILTYTFELEELKEIQSEVKEKRTAIKEEKYDS